MMKQEKPARSRSGKPQWQQKIALERIGILFALAAREFGRHPERSDRYAGLARKIGMRYNVRIPKELRMRFCRYCLSYLVPGRNCTVRTNSRLRSVEVKCHKCGRITRFPYLREKLAKRKKYNGKKQNK